jgi:hypothetical protein
MENGLFHCILSSILKAKSGRKKMFLKDELRLDITCQ